MENIKETDYLCKCNMCDSILRDENPQTGAEKHELTGKELQMEWDVNDPHWVCPICGVDDYLMDL